jgi:hypothetical protein
MLSRSQRQEMLLQHGHSSPSSYLEHLMITQAQLAMGWYLFQYPRSPFQAPIVSKHLKARKSATCGMSTSCVGSTRILSTTHL